ncbi:MAG: HAMP domain-containing protein [Candidatus Aminicenantes bacterium]|nr:HAMP domain-containing protein [Candidatus Aminicenantes bacterium]
MKHSIFFKVFGGFVLIIVALTALFLFFSFRATRAFYLDSLASNLEKLGSSLKFSVMPFIDRDEFEELDVFVKRFGMDIETRITIIDPDGVVLADSEEDPRTMVNHRFRPEIAEAFAGTTGRSLRFSNTVKANMLYVGLPLTKGEQIIGVLRVSLFVRDINKLLASMRSDILPFFILVTLVSLLGAFLISRSLSEPIKELSAASSQVASGNFGTQVYLKNRDELGLLAKSFNHMTGQIENLISELTGQKEELKSIISSIDEGIITLDTDGKILLSNPSFQDIIQSENVDGKFYWEVVRKPDFNEFIKTTRDEKKNNSQEIEFGERTLLCSAAFLSSREELVVTFYDLTKIKEVERIKKDFIVNVSHELRTPLTAIKGYVETLSEDIDEGGKHYMKIIERNTDRLINIVNDLLTLSGVEEKEIDPEFEDVNLQKVTENVMKIFEQSIAAKNLSLIFNIEKDLPSIKGDTFKLEQMFINLVDNAVKYTDEGSIGVELKREDGKVIAVIQDTGIGIPQKDIKRIFERFYVVDKSRSRSQGGTGLGLSIVKHIARLHSGNVQVESTEGQGTKVTIEFPL